MGQTNKFKSSRSQISSSKVKGIQERTKLKAQLKWDRGTKNHFVVVEFPNASPKLELPSPTTSERETATSEWINSVYFSTSLDVLVIGEPIATTASAMNLLEPTNEPKRSSKKKASTKLSRKEKNLKQTQNLKQLIL